MLNKEGTRRQEEHHQEEDMASKEEDTANRHLNTAVEEQVTAVRQEVNQVDSPRTGRLLARPRTRILSMQIASSLPLSFSLIQLYRLWQWFSSVDTDRSGAITAEELQQALVNGDWTRTTLRNSSFDGLLIILLT